MSFTKINAAGIGSTETITISGINVVGEGSFGGNVSVAGTLTYEDVTNVDSVGLITARNGVVVGGGITLSKDGDGFFTGIVTATQYYGDGSNLTGITQTTINNNADNRLITGSGTANTLNAKANLTFDNTSFLVGSGVTLSSDGDGFFTGITTATSINVGSGITLSSDGDGFFTGITTATSINVGSGITLSSDGNAFHTGIVTATSVAASGVDLTGLLKEDIKITNGKLSDNTNIDLENGMVHYFLTTESTTSTPNIRFSSSETLNSKMSYGESISVTIITTAAAAAYSAQLSIDGTTGFGLTHWVGGDAPSDGGSSGVDIYAYTIIKIGDATFKVIGNQSKTS